MSNAMETGKIESRGTVTVEVVSGATGREYSGDFTWRRRTLNDMGKIAQVQSESTNGTVIVDRELGAVLRAFAELSVVIEKYPVWWEEVSELNDIGVILAVYARYIKWVDAPFRAEREERQQRREKERLDSGSVGASEERRREDTEADNNI